MEGFLQMFPNFVPNNNRYPDLLYEVGDIFIGYI